MIVSTTQLELTETLHILVRDHCDQMASIGEVAWRQIADHCGIPARYFNRMRDEAPVLLCLNVNHWFWHVPADRLLEIRDGELVIFASPKLAPRRAA